MQPASPGGRWLLHRASANVRFRPKAAIITSSRELHPAQSNAVLGRLIRAATK